MFMQILLNQSEEREKIGNIVPGLWIGSFLDFSSSSFSLWLTTRMQLSSLIMFFLLQGFTCKIPILLWNTLLNGFPLKLIKNIFKRLNIWAYLCIINSLCYSVASYKMRHHHRHMSIFGSYWQFAFIDIQQCLGLAQNELPKTFMIWSKVTDTAHVQYMTVYWPYFSLFKVDHEEYYLNLGD